MGIEIRRAESDRMQLNFMAIPTSLFYLEEIFCTHLLDLLATPFS